jgi:hypothetical protein
MTPDEKGVRDHRHPAGDGVTLAAAQTPGSAPPKADCCRHEELAEKYGVIWTGMSQTMTIEHLAAYAAPVMWFSPDERLLMLVAPTRPQSRMLPRSQRL